MLSTGQQLVAQIPWGHNLVIIDFLTLSEKHDEHELETALVNHVMRFFLELEGVGHEG